MFTRLKNGTPSMSKFDAVTPSTGMGNRVIWMTAMR